MERIYAGIDLGGTTAKLGLFGEDSGLIRKWEIPTRKEDGGSHVIPDLAATIRGNLEEAGLAFDQLKGVGLAVPGPIRDDGYLEVCVNIGMKDTNPVKELQALLGGVPVRGGNDANVAALGEFWQGGGKGYQDMVAVTLGTGVGGGIIVDGKIHSGSRGMGGEIGHMIMDWSSEALACNCGAMGCLETISSATGIARRARYELQRSTQDSMLRSIPADQIVAKDVFDAAKAGDALGIQIAEYCMEVLARALAVLTVVIDPEAFVIGGGVSKAGDYLLDMVKRFYEPMVKLSAVKPAIKLAQLGNDAGIFGAAKLAMEA